MKEKILNFLRKIKEKTKSNDFLSDKLVLFIFLITLFLNIVLWILVIIKSRQTEVVFYSPVAASIFYLAQKGKEIYAIPIIGIFVFLINFLLAIFIFKREKFLSYLLLGISLFIQTVLLTTIIFYLTI